MCYWWRTDEEHSLFSFHTPIDTWLSVLAWLGACVGFTLDDWYENIPSKRNDLYSIMKTHRHENAWTKYIWSQGFIFISRLAASRLHSSRYSVLPTMDMLVFKQRQLEIILSFFHVIGHDHQPMRHELILSYVWSREWQLLREMSTVIWNSSGYFSFASDFLPHSQKHRVEFAVNMDKADMFRGTKTVSNTMTPASSPPNNQQPSNVCNRTVASIFGS